MPDPLAVKDDHLASSRRNHDLWGKGAGRRDEHLHAGRRVASTIDSTTITPAAVAAAVDEGANPVDHGRDVATDWPLAVSAAATREGACSPLASPASTTTNVAPTEIAWAATRASA